MGRFEEAGVEEKTQENGNLLCPIESEPSNEREREREVKEGDAGTHPSDGWTVCEMCVYEMVKMGDVKCMRGMCVCYGGKVCVCVSLRERDGKLGKTGRKI